MRVQENGFCVLMSCLVASLVCSACSSSTTNATSPADAGTDAAAPVADAASSAAAYPDGPYGIVVGAVFPNVTWRGKHAGTGAVGALSSADYYDPTGSRGIRGVYFTVTVTGAGCGPCLMAASANQAAYGGPPLDFAKRGGRMVDVLIQSWTAGHVPSTESDIDVWVAASKLTYDVVIDPAAVTDAGVGPTSLGAIGDAVPTSLVVDARTMKITAVFIGLGADSLKAFDKVLVTNGG